MQTKRRSEIRILLCWIYPKTHWSILENICRLDPKMMIILYILPTFSRGKPRSSNDQQNVALMPPSVRSAKVYLILYLSFKQNIISVIPTMVQWKKLHFYF